MSRFGISRPRVLVVSAFAPELAPLRRRLRQPEFGAWVRDDGLRLDPVGIGLVEAALGAARALAAHAHTRTHAHAHARDNDNDSDSDSDNRASADAVIFVGTAGAYGPPADEDALAPGAAVVVADAILLVSTAVVGGQAYLPDRVPTRVEASKRLSRRLFEAARRVTHPAERVVRGAVANPLAITRNARLARALATATAARAENLEVFAVARAAAARRIPFAAVLGIANRVGPAAHAEWRQHQAAASAAACAAVAEFLRTLAPPARDGDRQRRA